MRKILNVFVLFVTLLLAGCSGDSGTGPCAQGCTASEHLIMVWYNPPDLSNRNVTYEGSVPPAKLVGTELSLRKVFEMPRQFVSGDILVPGVDSEYLVSIKDSGSRGDITRNVFVSVLQGPGGLTKLYRLKHIRDGKLWFRLHPNTASGQTLNAWIQTEP